MANKPTKPNYPLGLHSDGVSEFAQGLLNYGLIEHAPGAVLTVPEGNDTLGEVSAIRYNAATDEFEGYYTDGWRTMGGGGGRWEAPTPAATYAAEIGRGYLIDSSNFTSTLTLPTPKKIGDTVSVVDIAGAFATHPLTISTQTAENIYGSTEELTLATASMAATFTWAGDNQGWVITSGVGLGQGRVNNRIVMLVVAQTDTSHLNLSYKPDYLDIYVDGKRLAENAFDLVSTGIDFNPAIAAGSEVQVIEYTPVNLSSLAGTNTFEVTSEAEMLALDALQGDMAVRKDTSVTYRLKAAPASILANWVSLQGGSSTFTVATETAMLALAAAKGDMAVRSDTNITYRLKDNPASTLANWVVVSGVNKVNGRTGNVQVAERGVNSDITSLTGLTGGPLTLGGDAVSDYDAVTLRQARNMSGGSTGPTMNGVMNFGVGQPIMGASRAVIPPGTLPQDGQLVNRADWPELWAHAQQHTPITDAAWLADPTQRGKYSSGDGTTTFRLPDWNGVQSNSIPGVFFRGGNGAADMVMAMNAAPNVTGSLSVNSQYSFLLSGAVYTGPFGIGTTNMSGFNGINGGTDARAMTFDLSKGHAAYGRNNSEEVVPNKVSGVWLVRASGVFNAANTSFQVINSDATLPNAGTLVRGGELLSTYRVGSSTYVQAGIRSKVVIGGAVGAELVIKDGRSGTIVETVYDLLGGYLGQTFWHDMRSKPPLGTVAADGQEVDIAGNFANLYADVAAGNHPTCTESEWWADPTKRSCYVLNSSTGKMRLPDRNGVQTGSIAAPVMRGDSGTMDAGSMQKSAVPNVKFSFGGVESGTTPGAVNPFGAEDLSRWRADGMAEYVLGSSQRMTGVSGATGNFNLRLSVDASKTQSVYNDSATEARMNSMVGCFVIRYTGSAQNAGAIDALTLSTRIESVNTDLQAKVVATNGRIGYALLSVTNPALNSRTVLTNPFGNGVPVICMCEIFHATLQKWVTGSWLYGSSTSVHGINSAYSEGEGIILVTGKQSFLAMDSGTSQTMTANYTTPSPVRIHVWKVTN